MLFFLWPLRTREGRRGEESSHGEQAAPPVPGAGGLQDFLVGDGGDGVVEPNSLGQRSWGWSAEEHWEAGACVIILSGAPCSRGMPSAGFHYTVSRWMGPTE